VEGSDSGFQSQETASPQNGTAAGGRLPFLILRIISESSESTSCGQLAWLGRREYIREIRHGRGKPTVVLLLRGFWEFSLNLPKYSTFHKNGSEETRILSHTYSYLIPTSASSSPAPSSILYKTEDGEADRENQEPKSFSG